jgi:hypothetical protein
LKYHNKKTVIDGIKFDSKKEAARWCELKSLEKDGEIFFLRRQVPFVLLDGEEGPDGKKLRPMKYVADFVYTDKDGDQVVEDSKGMKTDVYKIKKRLMWHIHGIAILET